MAPFTWYIPKCLLPVGDKPVLRYIIDRLGMQGYNDRDIILCINKQYEGLFRHEFRDKKDMQYSVSSKSLGTAGEVYNVRKWIDGDNFLMIYGDDLTDIKYGVLEDTLTVNWKSDPYLAILALTTKVRSEVGHVGVEGNEIVKFEEKPFLPVNTWTGTAFFNYDIMDLCKVGGDFAIDIFPKLVRKRKLLAYITDSLWMDVGVLSHWRMADKLAREGKI